MSAERAGGGEQIFNRAAEIDDPAARAAYLERACGGDPRLRADVEQLLEHDARAGRFLDGSPLAHQPTVAPDDSAAAPLADDDQRTRVRYVGDYELFEEIGRGGMGVVYKARQVSLDRTVAVKMILAGQLASASDRERFRVEARAAGQLQHPNIVAIHEVGEHQGHAYFSMDYLPGPNLAESLRAGPWAAGDAARLVKSVAAAVDYAHQQGVLHRDLKPSNILLDTRRRPADPAAGGVDPADAVARITDFGLAKRLSGPEAAGDSQADARWASLTDTGQLLGTPAYMAPEQAAGGKLGPVGPATDVYALGTILYELLTGRPPHQAPTPLETVLQVLDQDPVPPRQLNSRIPRDLETITLKCLAKQPAARYATAQELADDLQRLLGERPILARRVGPAGRAWRWLRRQQRSVAVAILAMVATALLAIVLLLGRYAYLQSQLAWLRFETDRPHLLAEILAGDGSGHAVRSFTVPTAEPIAVAEGSYAVRFSTPGRLSQTMLLDAMRGERPSQPLNLEEQILWPTIPVDRAFLLGKLDGRTDLLLLDDDGVTRIDGHTGNWRRPRWQLQLAEPTEPALVEQPVIQWPWQHALEQPTGWDKFDLKPYLVSPGVDLDGDGTDDLILAARHQAWLLAVSGSSGEVLWIAPRGRRLSRSASDRLRNGVNSAVVAPPLWLQDLDGDRLPDLLVAFADASSSPPIRWLEAISAADGRTIWRRDLDDQLFALPPGVEPAYFTRWFHGPGGGIQGRYGRLLGTRDRNSRERTGAALHVPEWLTSRQSTEGPVILVAAGLQLLILDPATGQDAAEPLLHGHRLARPPQLADLNGNGREELVLVEELRTRQGGQRAQSRLSVWCLGERRQLWSTLLHVDWPPLPAWGAESAEWPLAADLNGDRRLTLLVPWDTSDVTQTDPRRHQPPWGELAALDGPTGKLLWKQRIHAMDQQLDHFIVGPDVDGDGHRDVFVATLLDDELYVDALSGSDGQRLWWNHTARVPSSTTAAREWWLNRLRWLPSGHDGWPQLAVSLLPASDDVSPQLLLYSARSGALGAIGLDLPLPQLADLDGNGASDLLVFQPDVRQAEMGGRLDALRTAAGEAWRRLSTGSFRAGSDFNGDGTVDVISLQEYPPQLAAVSARTGQTIWQVVPELGSRRVVAASHDLDRDGVADVIVASDRAAGRGALQAISGRTGKPLWSLDVQRQALDSIPFVECHDLDGDRRLEVLAVLASDWGYPDLRGGWDPLATRLRLVVADGPTGRIRWHADLSEMYGAAGFPGRPYRLDLARWQPAIADVNGDGTADIIVPAEAAVDPLQFELRAFSGRDGSLLWRRPLHRVPPNDVQDAAQQAPHLATLTAEPGAAPSVAYIDFVDLPSHPARRRRMAEVVALDGRSGEERWRWEIEVDYECGRIGFDPTRAAGKPTLLAVEDWQTRESILCVALWENRHLPGRVVLLGADGRLLQEIAVPPGDPFQLQATDLTGDGKPELLLAADNVQAFRPGSVLERLWQWEPPLAASRPRLLSVAASDGVRPAELAVAADNVVYGIGGDGRVVWTCQSPQPRNARGSVRSPHGFLNVHMLWGNRGGGGVLFELPDGQAAYHRLTRAGGQAVGLPRDPAVPLGRAVPGPDPRTLIPLFPTRVHVDYGPLWFAALGALSFLVPLAFVASMVRSKRYSVGQLLLLPLVVGVALAVLSIPWPDEAQRIAAPLPPWLVRAVFSALAVPLLYFPLALGGCLLRRNWLLAALLAAGWLAGGVVFSAVVAGTIFLPLEPGQRYSWDGAWHLGLLPVAWGIGVGVLSGMVWERVRRKNKRLQLPAGPARMTAGTP